MARVTRALRVVNLLAVTVPFLGFVGAAVMLWSYGFSWVQFAVFGVPFVLTSFGVTVGYHRLFTHRSFETSRPVMWMFAVFGSMAVEGPLFRWVATHRRHHQLSDVEGDPHSPHLREDTFTGMLYGLWHAHAGWLFQPEIPGLARYIGDLRKDHMLRRISATFPLWVGLGLLIPTVLGGLLTQSWSGALIGFLWGGLARIFLVHHITWSINSVCHLWGGRPYETGDHSRNNVVFGVIGLGEGWHNNHHAFPNSARHGLKWWQLDISYILIRTMAVLGLAWKVNIPAQEVRNRKRRRTSGIRTAAATPTPAPPPAAAVPE